MGGRKGGDPKWERMEGGRDGKVGIGGFVRPGLIHNSELLELAWTQQGALGAGPLDLPPAPNWLPAQDWLPPRCGVPLNAVTCPFSGRPEHWCVLFWVDFWYNDAPNA
eukprot:363197-Chlamydomonas_euryale.AAC.5